MNHCNFKSNVKVYATGRYAKLGAQSKMLATSDNTLKSNVTEVLKRKCCCTTPGAIYVYYVKNTLGNGIMHKVIWLSTYQ